MRFFCGFLLILLTAFKAMVAEPPSPVTNIYILRGAEQLNAPHRLSYRLVEWSQMRGKMIFPDIGYYDSGYGKDQIWFAGAGGDFIQNKRFSWEQEFYFAQEAGPGSSQGRSAWVWSVFDFTLPRHSYLQAVMYPSIPLNRAQRFGFDVDRIKAEHRLGSHWVAGVGYTGGICASRQWQNSPFATVTRKTRAGNFEVWLQRVPGGSQAQVRYLLIAGET
jgi:hypothetical protein